MDKACKSNENSRIQVARRERGKDSGGRVSNTWVIYLQVQYNLLKSGLILDVIVPRLRYHLKTGTRKGLLLGEEPASYQLVGEVTAHQGYDG